jgi:hypothetical protein
MSFLLVSLHKPQNIKTKAHEKRTSVEIVEEFKWYVYFSPHINRSLMLVHDTPLLMNNLGNKSEKNIRELFEPSQKDKSDLYKIIFDEFEYLGRYHG